MTLVKPPGQRRRRNLDAPITGSERTDIDAFLDALYALPDHTGSDIDGFIGRLADAGVEVVAIDDGFEVRSAG